MRVANLLMMKYKDSEYIKKRNFSIVDEIEKTRNKLNNLIDHNESKKISNEIIEVSQELDELLVKYMEV